MSPTARAVGLGVALPWLAAAGVSAAAQESAAFVVTLGSDTITVERFSRDSVSISGELLTRYYVPATVRIRYRGTLERDGTVRYLRVSARPARPRDSTQVLWLVDVSFGDPSLIVRRRGDSRDTLRVSTAPGTLPFLIGSFGLMELVTRRARTAGQDRDSVSYLLLPGSGAFRRRVELRGADSATLGFISGEAAARIDPHGRVLQLDGDGSTYKVKVERLPWIDLGAVARGFVAQDSSGRALGNLSPRDSVPATIGSVSVRVNYGRPKRRGRQIMGGVVPWNMEWRTGANAPTTLELSGPLRVGDVVAAAGRYELTTFPTPTGVTLILRREGAGERDTAIRVPMRVEALATLVDDFTIGVVAGDAASRIELSWERTRWVVPLGVPPTSRGGAWHMDHRWRPTGRLPARRLTAVPTRPRHAACEWFGIRHTADHNGRESPGEAGRGECGGTMRDAQARSPGWAWTMSSTSRERRADRRRSRSPAASLTPCLPRDRFHPGAAP